ncbi:unnamed protein product [Psylliodes chrysocephalus]|uniref:RRM domain-containing protein n=1 Tax=Psylliodes chrysocephalus TaxID=3402493 RepID=A0A9P0D1U4_9CUCU|nr:unnamed protein product [Psylliodes chrysocephala]
MRNEDMYNMKVESNRIFISNLPETTTQEELQKAFSEYGEVRHIDIKERKELGKNTSLFFSYVTIDTDAKTLQTCFKDFCNGKWLGQYVMLQVARESFLDRLKRERENENTPKAEHLSNNFIPLVEEKQKLNNNGIVKVVSKKYDSNSSSSSSSSSSESEVEKKDRVSLKKLKQTENNFTEIPVQHDPDFVIKNNRGKHSTSKVLKIESVGKEPIITIDKTKKKVPINNSEANLRRLESLKNLKQGYQNQKSLIQAALANVDLTPKNKITFTNTKETTHQKGKATNDKNRLFNESDSEEEFEPTFSVKDHFQGKKGQKLLELQSKYKNDKRFTLNEKFLDDNITECQENLISQENIDDISLEEEKKKEYEILEEVLGKKIIPKEDRQAPSKKKMLRFDPSQPEHTKYEIPKVASERKEKRKRKNSDTEIMTEKRQEEKIAPEVSKEVFFSVSDNLKQTFEEKKEFSLLSMFGQYNDEEERPEEMEIVEGSTKISSKGFHKEKNPFKYDSSDDEDETEDITHQKQVSESIQKNAEISTRKCDFRKPTSWTDPFFFKLDDYRLQEGFDFVEKMRLDEKTEFTKLRRDLKEIVKAKVRNNLRKNKPFKKKLGGNRKKKVLRMKKAMKR